MAAGEARPWTEAETAGRLSVLVRSVLGRGEQERKSPQMQSGRMLAFGELGRADVEDRDVR